MLNKFVEPTQRLVDYDTYMDRLERTNNAAARTTNTEADDRVDKYCETCENSFVLFYSDLREQAVPYGLLDRGNAHDMWEVIMNNVEIEVMECTSDADVP